MIYAATKAIEAAMKEKDLKYDLQETDSSSAIRLGFSRDGYSFSIHFISKDDDPDVAVRVFDLINIPEAKRSALFSTLNDLNKKYRYFKFYLNSNDGLNVEYDFPLSISIEQVGKLAIETIARAFKILDDVYPTVMKALWS